MDNLSLEFGPILNSGQRDALHDVDTAFTMEREGCCNKLCLGCCCVMSDRCADGFYLHAGDLGNVDETAPGSVKFEGENVFGFAHVPVPCGGWCTPTLNIFDRDSVDGYRVMGKVEGPTVFGGMSELCAKTYWPVSTMKSPNEVKTKLKTGDMAVFTKLTPQTCGQAAAEAMTDSDKYLLQFNSSLTAQQKAMMLASVIQMDYMFFEQDNGMIRCENGGIVCTLFECYCCGTLCPCNLK